MHINDTWSKASRPAQLLAMLVTTALVILGITTLPTYAAAPTLKLAINADEDSYLSGVEQRYVVEFSCASTTEDCLDSVVTISLPHTITPGGNSNPDSAPEGINATATAGNKVVTPEIKRPTGTTDGLVTYNLGTVAAGTSFQTVLTFTAPRGVTPGGSTVTPVATFSSGDTTVTANDSVTIKSEPTPLLSKTGPAATPKNVDVTYQITPKYDTTVDGLNGKSNMTNVVVTDPLPQCATYVSSSASGNTITNTAATVPSSYDAATHTVTWTIGDVNPAFMNVVLSVTVHYDDTCADNTVTNTAKLTGAEMHNEDNVRTANASFTHHFDNEVRYGGGFNKRAMNQFERGKQGNWLYTYDNKSNVPVVLEYTDYMTCGLVSPTDGSKDCDKPLMRVKTIDTQTTTPIEITYWTNKGNTGTQTVYRGKAFDFSSFAADEYLTVFHYKQTIPAGESSILNVAGPIGAGTPTTENGVTYVDVDKDAAAWKAGKSDKWVRVQNCVTDFSMKSLDGTHDIAIPADDKCDVLTLGTALPKYYNAKSTIRGSLASPGSEVTFSVTANNTSTVVDSQPVISDLLPCGMTYVEGSVTGGPAGKDKTVTVRDVTDATGCTRQLVQVTWPGYQTKGGTTIQLRGKVGPSMSAGTHKNEAYISAAEPEYALTSKSTTICFYGSTDDTYDVNGDGNTADQVCPVSSTFTVSEQAGADVVLESLGSVPGSVYKKYTDGASVMRQGEDGQFRITPTNSGNADLSDITVYGILPHVGDTSVQGGASRNSEWEPTITGPIQVGTGSGIDPSQVTIEYSTSFNPCRGEVINQGDTMAASPAGCDNNWTATPASWSDVKSYRIYINGKATPIKAGASIPLIVPIKAPNNATGIAYESVAIAATQASNNRAILPTEPIKVALVVALDVALNKTVVSDADNLAPGDNVTFRIDAGNSGQGKAPDVKVAEAFPAGTTFVSAESHLCTSGYTSGVPGECSTGGAAGTFDGITWKLGDMLAGQHASLYVTVTLDEGTDGKTLENTASFVNPPEYDQNPDNNTAKASISVKHRLSGKVYYDANDSSSYTDGEEGFKDITVELLRPDGSVVATTTTDADGNYSFTRLAAGDYTVKVTKAGAIADLTQTEDPDATKDSTSGTVTLNAGNPVQENINFGYVKKHAISGTVYLDQNRDKAKDGGDIAQSGVTVKLVDASGAVVATTTTDADGNYSFTGLNDGTYTVQVDKTGPLASTEQTEDPSGNGDSRSQAITFTRSDPDVTNVNFGYAEDYTVSGTVYYDKDRSETLNNGEPGFGGVTVNLLDEAGATVATTTTKADGTYSFAKLPAGKYTVKVEPSDLLKKLEQTEDPDGTKDHTSGVVQVNHDNPSVQNVNFGYATNYTIKGTIYRDADRSESLEDGEKLYQGVTVDLLDASGNVVATTTTDAHGAYAFTNLEEGTYKVRVRKEGPIADLVQTEDPDATKDNTSGDITLELNDPIKENVNFGYISDNSISGTIYRDDNRSNSLNGGEAGYPEQTVQLLDKDGQVIKTTKTDANGNYSFDNLPDGTYSVKVVKDGALTDLEQTEDPDGAKDSASEPITLDEDNPTKKNVNFGYVPDYFIKGTIYRDGNRSGALDAGEKLYEGVTVNLVGADGTVVATTTTDADGTYSFDKLPAGTYTVTVAQDGPIAGLEQTGDPDATKDNSSEPITLNNDNPSTTDVNFGYIADNSLSGTVYRDDSRNGDQDGTEPGYSGVTVQLLDASGNVVTTTTTDANGTYSFSKLPDGTYSVKVVKDGELADTEQTEDPDATKDNASEPVTLGEDNPTKDHIDFGYVPDYSIHGLVYRDGDRDEKHGATEKGYANQTVELRDKDGKVVATTTTDANGAYSFEKLPAGDYTVKVVKDGALTDLDQTEDPDSTKDSASGVISLGNDHRTETDVNFGYIANNSINGTIYRDGDRDGRKGDTEGRYSGVTVQLLDASGNVVATTTTDKDGKYSFEHLPDGTYSVKVVKDGVLADADQTGDPDNKLDNASQPITLDENNPTKGDVDFGYVPNNTITGTVYRDDNRDKMINGDEPGLERVSVQLLDEDGKVLQTLDTDADGNYAFQHLPDGKYTVKVVRSSSIKDYDQTEDPDATVDDTSAVYTMGPGHSLQENVNFGYVPDYSIAGRVYRDSDKSGSYTDGEETFGGVTVDLLDKDGNVVATTTTDKDGNYSFEKLPAGTYRVKVHPDGALAGLDQTEDPDGIADSMSGEITIGFDNQLVTGVNFGYVAPDAPAVEPSIMQRLARTGFDGLGGAGLGAAAAGGLLLWMRRRRQG
ncbi:Cna protein B-type domain protein [Actinomyces sp. ICM58]|uniref:SdrD B-like domain-containing protein n=1 Tax=Actinomyces sp. ICM58 TaxID=1105030 RepID=UPI000277241A|nr:SdrD B-like domain-containing protein [Actinomyces sp. ICM58]EJN52859.1 Cna protein B-type domain protein [Actinomyces sp. ICM58]